MGDQPALEKTLSYKSLLFIAINSIMGTGIFFLPAAAAAKSGPASLIAWTFMALTAIYISMCFAELTSMYPTSGGIYEFSKQAFGRTMSFFIGWTTVIAGYITIAMLIIGALQYIFPEEALGAAKWYIVAIAIFFVVLFNYITYQGLETSTTMLVAFSMITLTTILGLIIPSIFHFRLENLQPFTVGDGSSFLILATVFVVAETFFGWETATFLAEETKDGEKVVPKALVHSTVIISVICLTFVTLSLGAMPWQEFAESQNALTLLAQTVYPGFEGINAVIGILIYLSIIGSVAGWIVSAPRLILALSEDGLFIHQLAKISETKKTPVNAIIFQTVVIIIFIIIGSGSYEKLLHMLVPMVLLLYAFVMLTVVILRKKQPDVKRHYIAPAGTWAPIIVVFIFIGMIVFWGISQDNALQTLVLGGSLIATGIPIYFLVELYNNHQFTRGVKNKTAYYTLFFENQFIPKKVQEEVLMYLGDISGKTVLEYGCSVGTLTQHLIYAVGSEGRVICVNNAEKELKILHKRISKPKHKALDNLRGELSLIHHPAYHEEVHESIGDVDTIISIDTLSNIADPENIIEGLSKIIPENGRICFFDFGDFFRVIPNQHWMSSNEKIQEVFHKNGFRVHVKRSHGLFWSFVFVYGVKSDEDVVIV
ncbi:MAG: APA family basic amino acid/polyamine antiporter [Candidatus Woesearchaeota archaeon]|jgi:APA family basic amino acid/polyamine antiporter